MTTLLSDVLPTALQAPTQSVTQTADSVAATVDTFWSSLLQGEGMWKVVVSFLVILLVVLLRRIVLGVLEDRVEEARTRYRWSKVSAYVAFFASAVVVVVVWTGGELVSLGTFLGLLTAGLAIALRDLVANLAGWIFIMWRRPFDIGDRIQIAGHAGDVVDLRVFQFTILEIGNWVGADQSTGRVIHIPNQKVFSDPQANYTAQFDYLWHEIPVLVTFESDWRRAKEILTSIAEEHASDVVEEARQAVKKASRKFLIFYRTVTPVVYTTVVDSGVQLTIRYLCGPRTRRSTAEKIWEAVLDAFAEHDDIELAYPTRRAYFNPVEGKPGARQPLPGLPDRDGTPAPDDGPDPDA